VYNDLYKAWKRESESGELGRLPSDFYGRMADYLRRLREESRMLDRKTVKANLLEVEMRNVRRMLRGLVWMRCRKLLRMASEGQRVSPDVLTVEEAKMCEAVSPLVEAYQKFARVLLQGHVPNLDVKSARKRAVLRFFKDIPAIIGADMETYGPFRAEDVGSVPVENARVLVKQGLAEIIEFA